MVEVEVVYFIEKISQSAEDSKINC